MPHRLSGTVLIADSRTKQTDVDFALRQLVDVGLRVGSLLRRLLLADPPAEAVAGPGGRLLRPWQLSAEEYVAHGFDQLRHAAPAQPQVAAALVRVLRMLVVHVGSGGRPEHAPALRRQRNLLLDALRAAADLHPADLARLEAIATGADPADHSRRWAPPDGDDAPRQASARPRTTP